ncbi:MAG: hypothetical protein CL789_04625 [Chloroflexi bacterium]|nr:hypothetical protein [Chloroflexota bacterium]MBS59829.1 hypothetical protein [Anaerolineaceae bacterium]
MKYIKSTIEMLVWSVMFGAIYVQPVSAYLDPGGGSLIIQFLLASIVGILFVIRQFWGRIISFIKRFVVSDVDSDYKQDTDSNND